MEQVLALPAIGSCFRNQENTEIYRVILAGNHYVWVNGIDCIKGKYFETRPYGTVNFLKAMIPLSRDEVCSYGLEKMYTIQEFIDKVINF